MIAAVMRLFNSQSQDFLSHMRDFSRFDTLPLACGASSTLSASSSRASSASSGACSLSRPDVMMTKWMANPLTIYSGWRVELENIMERAGKHMHMTNKNGLSDFGFKWTYQEEICTLHSSK